MNAGKKLDAGKTVCADISGLCWWWKLSCAYCKPEWNTDEKYTFGYFPLQCSASWALWVFPYTDKCPKRKIMWPNKQKDKSEHMYSSSLLEQTESFSVLENRCRACFACTWHRYKNVGYTILQGCRKHLMCLIWWLSIEQNSEEK